MQQIKINNIGDYALSARLNTILKLPHLDNNAILSYRPTIKNLKNKKQHQNNFVKRKQKTQPSIQTNNLKCKSNQKKLYITQSQQAKKANSYKPKIKVIKKKIFSQISIDQQKNSVTNMQTKTQKHILQTILKLTQQLGMNSPDYVNYMKKAREQMNIKHQPKEKNIRRKVITSIKRSSTDNSQNNHSFSEPLHFVAFGTKYNQNMHNKDILLNNPIIQNQSDNIHKVQTKFKIKRKDKYLKYRTINQNEQQQKLNEDIGKSIRGWTKYGRFYEQI